MEGCAVLTVDSESWLGSEIHPTYEAALQSLIEAGEWVENVEQGMGEEEVRDAGQILAQAVLKILSEVEK